MMKRVLISLVVLSCFLFNNSVKAGGGGCTGCVIDTTACTGLFGAVCPDSIPPGNIGVYYDQDITFNLPASISVEKIALPQPITIPVVGITLDTIDFGQPITLLFYEATLDSVANLPAGMNWECNIPSNNCVYNPDTNDILSQFGCVKICGIPCADTGANPIVLTFTLQIDLSNVDLSQAPPPFNLIPANLIPDTLSAPFPLPVSFRMATGLAPLEITKTPDLDYICPGGAGGSVTLKADGFANYAWSNGSNADSTVVTGPGVYQVSVMDTFGCSQADSVELLLLKADAGLDSTICSNQITQLSGSGGPNFSWTPTTNLSSDSVSDPVIFDLAFTTDFVLEVNNGFCTDVDSVTITIDDTECEGVCTGKCNLNKANCTGTFPEVCSSALPTLEAGDNYETSFTFFFPSQMASTDLLDYVNIPDIQIPVIGISLSDLIAQLPSIDVPINEIAIDVRGLPNGIDWECDQIGNNNTYYPSLYPDETQYGCIKLCGDSVCDNADDYVVEVVGTIDFNLPLPVQVPGFSGLTAEVPMPVVLPVRSVDGFLDITTSTGSTVIQPGQDVTLTVPDGFVSYQWSTGGSNANIVVNSAGTYGVTAVDHNGCNQVNEVTLTNPPVGVEDFDLNQSLVIYPNPNNGDFDVTFDLPEAEGITIEVYSIEGKRIFSEIIFGKTGSNSCSVVLPAAADGVYLLKVTSENGVVNRRLTVN